ncbi:hypothetical protein DEU56DRAFT_756196 [Suillus clintonianus]|uniref:uncharacterized protein n=1 Tax=Suillus clintonianus TaxID=1904413 RepID=UPI001B87DD59|nr:uncharacterized protein DEU56DRAFT_756196 [Suillus clintonianus]KAG2137073.1 hypothetical protein DEU56DRAFT_756196 [Suillus clintonianus]
MPVPRPLETRPWSTAWVHTSPTLSYFVRHPLLAISVFNPCMKCSKPLPLPEAVSDPTAAGETTAKPRGKTVPLVEVVVRILVSTLYLTSLRTGTYARLPLAATENAANLRICESLRWHPSVPMG